MTKSAKPTVLVLLRYYLPGFKAGGPIQSISNLINLLEHDFRFLVVTSDRDLGDKRPYPQRPVGEWVSQRGCQVLYLRSGPLQWLRLIAALVRVRADVIYVNSFLDRTFSIIPVFLRHIGLTQRPPVLVAPRGEFSPGALNIKRWRKLAFIKIARMVGAYSDIYWHASTDYEKSDIQRHFEDTGNLSVVPPAVVSRIFVASDVAGGSALLEYSKTSGRIKVPGGIRLVFVSRISRKKNLDFALSLLAELRGQVEFTIFGPIEDEDYWGECRRAVSLLPQNVAVQYGGALSHDEVCRTFGEYHFFLFPTHGENYGHVVVESMLAGCPLIISDQTPWRDLEQHQAGWDIPLSARQTFVEVVQSCIDMDNSQYETISKGARTFAHDCVGGSDIVSMNRELFNQLVAQCHSPVEII